jgi:hypothetical protein
MSQATKTTLGSCGLMVGRNMAPPPPGPTTRHRWEPVSEREAGQSRSKQRAVKPARAWSAVRVMCLLGSRAVQIPRFAVDDIPFDTIFLSIMQKHEFGFPFEWFLCWHFQGPKGRNLARFRDRSANLRTFLFNLLLFSLHAYVMLSFDVICMPVCLRACRRCSKG